MFANTEKITRVGVEKHMHVENDQSGEGWGPALFPAPKLSKVCDSGGQNCLCRRCVGFNIHTR